MQKITKKEYVYIASMLFGLFFGAGNLIFPVYLGQMAGRNSVSAALGFLCTGVGLPLLGIVAMGISHSNGLLEMASRVSKKYGLIFTAVLYLTIGPFFAIPRTATVSFSVGIEPLVHAEKNGAVLLLLFTFLFFAFVLFFSLRPSKIMTWIGKILTPLFLILLGILIVISLVHPMGNLFSVEPSGDYVAKSFFTGFMEGYNTMDALASLAFGIIVINVIKGLGVQEPTKIAIDTIKSGFLSMVLMAVIYVAIIVMGAQSRGLLTISNNGGVALALIAYHYFGSAGAILLAALITFACLKTAIGLITSCSETFVILTDHKIGYRTFAVSFCILSSAIANLSLSRIINYSIPVLMLLYPLVITLIFLNIFGRFFSYSIYVFRFVTFATLAASFLDFLNTLPKNAQTALHVQNIPDVAAQYLPFFVYGMGWIMPSCIGFLAGFAVSKIKETKKIKR